MANALEMLSKIQFSTFRLAKSHVPAQAVELTQASHAGTVEGVNAINAKYSTAQPPNMIIKEIIHSRLFANLTVTGVVFF